MTPPRQSERRSVAQRAADEQPWMIGAPAFGSSAASVEPGDEFGVVTRHSSPGSTLGPRRRVTARLRAVNPFPPKSFRRWQWFATARTAPFHDPHSGSAEVRDPEIG